MKRSIYTTLLLAFIFLTLPCKAQSTKDREYKNFYKSVNKTYGKLIISGQQNDPDIITDTITVGELDSVMKNLVGVTDVIRGGKSLLHPVVTLELDPFSSASNALFGCVETLNRQPEVGKGIPEPQLAGIVTVKRGGAVAETPAPTTQAVPKTQPAPKPATDQKISNEDWKLFRSVPVTLVDESEKVFVKKYSVIIGTFRSMSNAEFVRRTFNGLGDRTIIVKNKVGLYYTIVGSFDNDVDALVQLENFTKKYAEGQSVARRISRYGVPLDDLWILIHD